MDYRGRCYIIGSGHKEFTDKKIIDEDYYVLTLAAIAREMNTRKLTGGKIVVAAGLPLTWMVKQQSEYREYLLRNRNVEFNFRGQDYHIELADAMIYPQGYAAIADRLNDFRDVNVVADIGNGTINLLRVIDRRVDVRSMAAEARGVKDYAISMRIALANRHGGAKVDDSIIERVIRSGTARIDTEYLETLKMAAQGYTNDLFRRFREYGYDEKTMQLFVVGDGSCLIRNFASYDPKLVSINSDIHANAKGYEWLAYERLRMKGSDKP